MRVIKIGKRWVDLKSGHINPGSYFQRLLICLSLFWSNYSICQQRPRYTQYVFNAFLVNPSIAGIENYVDLKSGYRNQWAGLSDAPKTTYLTIHAPIGKKYLLGSATSVPENGYNPLSRSYLNEYSASEPHHGIGFHIVADKAGIFEKTDITAAYAYHIGLQTKLNLAVGVAAGVTQYGINEKKATTEIPNDPMVTNNANKVIRPALSLGIWLYGANFFAGLSADQLLTSAFKVSDPTSVAYIPHMYFKLGYKFIIGEETALLPSCMIIRSKQQVYVDYNTKLTYKGRVWVGASYRHKESFAALTGFNINSLFSLSYSYDFAASGAHVINNSSHEFVLGLLLNNKYKVICPQNQM